MAAERDGFLENCATRINSLINRQLRSPTAEEIKAEIGAALDQTWPGVGQPQSEYGCGLKPPAPEAVKKFQEMREAYRQELREKTTGISPVMRGGDTQSLTKITVTKGDNGQLVGIPDWFEPQPRADYFHVREKQRKHDEAVEQAWAQASRRLSGVDKHDQDLADAVNALVDEAEVEIKHLKAHNGEGEFYHPPTPNPVWPGYQLTGFAVHRMRRAGFELRDRKHRLENDSVELVFTNPAYVKDVSVWVSGLELMRDNDPERLNQLAIARCEQALRYILPKDEVTW